MELGGGRVGGVEVGRVRCESGGEGGGEVWYVLSWSIPYREVQKYWMKRNIHLLAWTVNSKEEADKLVAMGIPVLTDDVAVMT